MVIHALALFHKKYPKWHEVIRLEAKWQAGVFIVTLLINTCMLKHIELF